MTRLSQPCDKVVTTMSAIDKVVTTLWIGCHVKLRLSSLCYNLVCKDRHYLVVKVNVSDVHYYIVVKVNTFDFTFFTLILMW